MTSFASSQATVLSLEDWLQNPPERTEWVNGTLIEKNGMTLKHSRIQAKLATLWRNYKESHEPGGEVYTEAPCRTYKQGRSPDVAYLTPDLVKQYGDARVLPQSFPLVAEIISPTDFAEDIFGKANEYLESDSQEVWLVLPESHWIVVMTQHQKLLFRSGETIEALAVLQGFRIGVDELIA